MANNKFQSLLGAFRREHFARLTCPSFEEFAKEPYGRRHDMSDLVATAKRSRTLNVSECPIPELL